MKITFHCLMSVWGYNEDLFLLKGISIQRWGSRHWKTRTLSMLNFICCTRQDVFTSFARLKKKFNWLELYFPVAGEYDFKVNKTQRICTVVYTKIDERKKKRRAKYCYEKLACHFSNQRSSRSFAKGLQNRCSWKLLKSFTRKILC